MLLQKNKQQKTVFDTPTYHRGRSLEEQQLRHKAGTGHTRVGKLYARINKETKMIHVFQECLDCNPTKGGQPSLKELQNKPNTELVTIAQSIGARGHKQMNKADLIESIINQYESASTITNS